MAGFTMTRARVRALHGTGSDGLDAALLESVRATLADPLRLDAGAVGAFSGGTASASASASSSGSATASASASATDAAKATALSSTTTAAIFPHPSDPKAPNITDVAAALTASGRIFGSDALRDMTLAARAELTGAGPLQYWLEQEGVTDVLVNSPDQIWVEQHGELRQVDVSFGSPGAVRALAVRLAALAGQRLDDAAPICDGVLPDGTRFHALLPPLSAGCAVISLRVLRQRAFTLAELAARAMLPATFSELLQRLVARRANIVISGGTGTGKTTLLAALLSLAPPGERLITVEEARELTPLVAHHVSLVGRRANVEGAGEVDLAALVRTALRMRPDRLVLGECRGAEIREVLQAMNTGHDGSMVTLHANSAAAVAARLEALGALAGMGREVLAAHAITALDVVLQLRRTPAGRQLAQVGVPVVVDGLLAVQVVAEWDGQAAPQLRAGWQQLWELQA